MTAGVKRPLQLAAVCWIIFAAVLVAAYAVPSVQWADGWAVEGFIHLQRPRLNDLATFAAGLADPGPFALWTVVLAGIALYRRRPRHALAVILLLGGANLASQSLKVLLEHPRYHEFLGKAQLGSEAFPSGHATASMALALAAGVVAAPGGGPPRRGGG